MHLPARLSSSTLGDLLGALHREGTTGLLELREIRGPRGRTVPGRIHRIHLRSGLVAAVDTALPVPPIGEILRRDRLVAEDVVRLLVSRIQAGDRRAAGEILSGEGLAAAEAVRAGLRRQLAERIEAIFGVEDASITFHTARPLPQAVRVAPLGASEFLRGRPRARDKGASKRGGSPPPPPPAVEAEPRSGLRPMFDEARERARRLLELPQGAGTGDVRRAFRKLGAMLHPDRLLAAPAEEQRARAAQFAELSAAYHLLVA